MIYFLCFSFSKIDLGEGSQQLMLVCRLVRNWWLILFGSMLSRGAVSSLSLVPFIVTEGLEDVVLLLREGCLGSIQHHFRLLALYCGMVDLGWFLALWPLWFWLAVWSIMLAPTVRVYRRVLWLWLGNTCSLFIRPQISAGPLAQQAALSFFTMAQGGPRSSLQAISTCNREPKAQPQAHWCSKHPPQWLLLFSVPYRLLACLAFFRLRLL